MTQNLSETEGKEEIRKGGKREETDAKAGREKVADKAREDD